MTFEVVYPDSAAAHYAARHLRSHYIAAANGKHYGIYVARRKATPGEEEDEDTNTIGEASRSGADEGVDPTPRPFLTESMQLPKDQAITTAVSRTLTAADTWPTWEEMRRAEEGTIAIESDPVADRNPSRRKAKNKMDHRKESALDDLDPDSDEDAYLLVCSGCWNAIDQDCPNRSRKEWHYEEGVYGLRSTGEIDDRDRGWRTGEHRVPLYCTKECRSKAESEGPSACPRHVREYLRRMDKEAAERVILMQAQ